MFYYKTLFIPHLLLYLLSISKTHKSTEIIMNNTNIEENAYVLGGMYTHFYHDGRYADWGDYALNAANMAIADINASKMLDKTLIMPDEFVEDYHCWPEHAEEIAENLMRKGILALTGIDCSGPAEYISNVAQKHKIPAISYGVNASLFSDPKKFPYFIRVVTPSETYDGYLVGLAAFLKVQNIVFFHTTDAWGLGAAKVVKEYAKKYNIEISKIIAYDRDTSIENMLELIKPLNEAECKNFIITAPTPDTVTVFKSFHALDMNKTDCHIFAAEMISSDEVAEAVYGSYGYFAPMTMLPPSKILTQFTTRFSHYIGEEVDTASKAFAYAAISYDHIYMVAHGIKNLLNEQKAISPENLMQALRNVDFIGLTGRVSITPNTNDRAYMSVQFLNNQGYNPDGTVCFIPVGSIDPESESIQFERERVVWPGAQDL